MYSSPQFAHTRAGTPLMTTAAMARTGCLFQSSPAPKDGRYPGRVLNVPQRLLVSILARPEGRALLVHTDAGGNEHPLFQSSPAPKDGRYLQVPGADQGSVGFNPRPPRRTGATTRRSTNAYSNNVSILARPEGRALRFWPMTNDDRRKVSILARPEGRALPDWLASHKLSVGFQSSPAPKDGRYGNCHRGLPLDRQVSILARPEGRALLRGKRHNVGIGQVSILARPEGRALLPLR